MARWYPKVAKDPKNFFVPLGEALEYFHAQYEEGQAEVRPERGSLIWKTSVNLSGIMEYRYGQLQEIEAILLFVEIQHDKLRGERKRHFLENYQRNLTDRQASDFADIEPDVILLKEFIVEVSFIRNLYLGLTKGLEMLHFQMGHLTKLKIAGFEDATF